MLRVDGAEVQELVENLDTETGVDSCALWYELLKLCFTLREQGTVVGYFRMLLYNNIIERTDFAGMALYCGIEVTDLQIRCSQVLGDVLVFRCQSCLLTC